MPAWQNARLHENRRGRGSAFFAMASLVPALTDNPSSCLWRCNCDASACGRACPVYSRSYQAVARETQRQGGGHARSLCFNPYVTKFGPGQKHSRPHPPSTYTGPRDESSGRTSLAHTVPTPSQLPAERAPAGKLGGNRPDVTLVQDAIARLGATAARHGTRACASVRERLCIRIFA